jgi:hypothetical protein
VVKPLRPLQRELRIQLQLLLKYHADVLVRTELLPRRLQLRGLVIMADLEVPTITAIIVSPLVNRAS